MSVSESQQRAWAKEHDTIYAAIVKAARVAAGWGAGGATSRQRRKLSAHIDKLLTVLTGHFAREEQGGLLVELRALVPDQLTVLERLAVEHHEIQQRLARVRGNLGSDDPVDAGELAAELDALVATLLIHERVEEQLAQRALKWAVEPRA